VEYMQGRQLNEAWWQNARTGTGQYRRCRVIEKLECCKRYE